MAWPHPFEPSSGGVVCTLSTASQAFKITDDTGEIDVRFHNDSTTTTYIAVGGPAVSVTTSNPLSLAAGEVKVMRFRQASFSPGGLYIAFVAAAAGGVCRAVPGIGI